MPSHPLFVTVAGNIGAGKSSLSRLLGEHFHLYSLACEIPFTTNAII